MKKFIAKLSMVVLALLCSSVSMATQTVNAKFSIPDPSTSPPPIGQQFTVTLQATDFVNVSSGVVALTFDASKVSFASPVVEYLCPSCLPATGPMGVGSGSFLTIEGTGNSRLLGIFPSALSVNGNFDMAVFTFQTITTGNPNIAFSDDGGNESGWLEHSDYFNWIPTNYTQTFSSRPLGFIDQTNVQLSALITSNTVTITGIAGPAPISVTAGEYSLGCTATFTTESATIANGQKVCVRHVNAGASSTLLNVGDMADIFTSTTGNYIDTEPEAFFFPPPSYMVPLSLEVQSDEVTILGINAPTLISVSGGVYSIGCFDDGPWDYAATPGLISNGQSVCVRHISAGTHTTDTSTTLTVGGITSSFSSRTLSLIDNPTDYTPDLFSFPDQPNVPLSSLRTSDPVTIRGTQVAVNISVTDGAYSIGCTGNFTSGAGTISSGQNVCVRHTSASTLDTATHTVLTVSNVSDRFTSTTTSAIPPPDDDGDGVANTLDNCTLKANPTQCDSDGDGYGNHCDGDLNNNGFTNAFDTPLYRAQLGQPSVGPTYNQADINCNGFVNAFDTPLFRSLLGRPLGPSGLHP